jgi:hypothetical protein
MTWKDVSGGFERALRRLSIFSWVSAAEVGRIVDRSWKRLLAGFLTEAGCKEGRDFLIPPENTCSSDFQVSDRAHALLQDLLNGRRVAVKAHTRNGNLVAAHFRTVR